MPPPPEHLRKEYKRYGLALRVQCLTLFEVGIPLDVICQKYSVTKSSLYRWKRIAKARGYDPNVSPILFDYHLEDAPRSGRPSLQTWERTQKLLVEGRNEES
jgi:hypothetical protein